MSEAVLKRYDVISERKKCGKQKVCFFEKKLNLLTGEERVVWKKSQQTTATTTTKTPPDSVSHRSSSSKSSIHCQKRVLRLSVKLFCHSISRENKKRRKKEKLYFCQFKMEKASKNVWKKVTFLCVPWMSSCVYE